MPRIALMTVGCKVNQYETEVLTELFKQRGFEVVPPDAKADVYLLNSCTVTATGDQKTRQLLRRMKKGNPSAVAVLTGCFPQAFPEAAEKIAEADVITGELNRARIPDLVEQALRTGEWIIDIPQHQRGESFEPMQVTGLHSRTRAYMKIEDGCERYCSYCIIPKARGPIRSKPMADMKKELEALAEGGYKEVVLVGINLSSYGKELGLRLIDAVKLACSIPGIKRVRLGSLEPELLSDEDIAEMAKLPNFCPQFHLALQSGCDATLHRMNRHYDGAFFADLVRRIRGRFDNCSVTTDVMVGFAGETEEEFEQSLEFVKSIGFARCHVFAYSRRAGTPADRMPNHVPRAEKERRSAVMIEAARQSEREFLQTQIGLCEPVLFESYENGINTGYSPNYTHISAAGEDMRGKIADVLITGASENGCTGEIKP